MALSEQEEFELLSLEREKSQAPASPTSKPMPVNAGLANLGASVLGMPAEAIKNVANLGIAGYGAVKGAMGGTPPDLIKSLPGDISNTKALFNRAAKDTGVAGLSTENPNPESKIGTAAYDFASRGGFIPGGALPAAGSMVGEAVGGTPGAIIGSMAPSAATSAYNAARAPALATAKAQNVIRDATLRDAQEAGYVLPPSEINPSVMGKAAESFAGKAALKQQAEIKNQQVTNRLIREELKVPENTPINEALLTKVRNDAAAPYREVAALSPSASKALENLRDARSQAKDQWRHWDMQGVPDAKRQAQAFDAKAEVLEKFIERQATNSGKPELVQQLRDARTFIAKTFDVERALNTGNGNIDAKIIGRAFDRRGENGMTGNLAIIGKFAEGPGRKFTREESKVPAPGVSKLNWPMAAALGAEGHHLFGAPGVAAAAIPFASGGVRQGMLSDLYQRNFARPNYEPALQPENQAQGLARILQMTGGK